MKRARGFTLIELIISVMLLAFISMFVGQAIQKGLQARAKITRDIDRTVALRESVNLISRDFQFAFNYRDINVKLYNAAVKERCKSPAASPTPTNPPGQPTPSPTPTQAAIDPNSDQCKEKESKSLTNFIGESDKVDFTTLSHVRLRKDDPTSDQAEVGYLVKNCKTRLKGEDAGKCLWRRVSPVIDSDITKGGNESVLIENVKTFTLRYLDEGTDGEWQKIWSSDGKSDTTRAGKFPLAVEITLQVFDNNFKPPKEIGMTVVAPLRFPNNPPKEDAAASDPTQQGAPSATPTPTN
jgi:prepilin-type N-terminal cleavage/methylation domain-containing protein